MARGILGLPRPFAESNEVIIAFTIKENPEEVTLKNKQAIKDSITQGGNPKVSELKVMTLDETVGTAPVLSARAVMEVPYTSDQIQEIGNVTEKMSDITLEKEGFIIATPAAF